MTVKLIILEGTRGSGKSTMAQHLRSTIWGSTLINPTGFSDDGYEGLKKIDAYYDALFEMIMALERSKFDHTILLDRFFFSEQVYSQMYKSYDFTQAFWYYLGKLMSIADVKVFLFETSREELEKRLQRNKASLFDNIEESADKSIAQQLRYLQEFKGIKNYLGRIEYDKVFITLNSDEFNSFEELAAHVKTIIDGEPDEC